MAKNTIKRMVQSKIRGVTNANGYNDHFYRIYDEEGRIVGSKEGITTLPGEMMPRQAHVKVDLEGFQPRATSESLHPSIPDSDHVIPQSQRRDADIVAEGRAPGATRTVQRQDWRTTPAQGEAEKTLDDGYALHRPTPDMLRARAAAPAPSGSTAGNETMTWGKPPAQPPTPPPPAPGPVQGNCPDPSCGGVGNVGDICPICGIETIA
jgi:hypothetical protein